MSNAIAMLRSDQATQKFREILGNKSDKFIASVLSVIGNNKLLKDADPNSVYLSAMIAASLDLPINQNLGFAYIVPYKGQAQFQMGYKGFIQLAIRSGQFQTIEVIKVYEGDSDEDVRTRAGGILRPNGLGKEVIGYASYFKLINSFEKYHFMTVEELKQHGLKFSQSFKKGYGLWEDDFDSMAEKTVLKLLLSKYAPLSVDMQTAVLADQGVIKDAETMDIEYPDNEEFLPVENEMNQDLLDHYTKEIEKCATIEELNEWKKQNKPTDKTILSLIEIHEDNLKASIQD